MNENEHIKKERQSTRAKKRLFLEALKKSLGVLAPAMEAAGVRHRDTIIRWREEDAAFAEAMDECAAVCGDFVENSLLRLVKEGNAAAVIFYCKTKLKNRGYTERTELTGKDGDPLIPGTPEEKEAEIERIKNILKNL